MVFGLIAFGLGVVGGNAMLKDDSLIGLALFYAENDLLVVVSMLESM
jgi:hypothetical protein